MFNNQRLVTLTIALLCFLQLAVVSLREFSEPGSKLHSLIKETLDLVGSGVSLSSSRAKSSSAVTHKQDDTPPLNKQTDTINRVSDVAVRGDGSTAGSLVAPSGVALGGAAARDPFVPFFKVRGDEVGGAKGELTSYELDQLKVTAVIRTAVGTSSASLESRDGRSFIVRPGTKIGVRGGTVEEITSSGVVVVREVGGIDGVTVVRRELGLR